VIWRGLTRHFRWSCPKYLDRQGTGALLAPSFKKVISMLEMFYKRWTRIKTLKWASKFPS
jgi:hypothetical protein